MHYAVPVSSATGSECRSKWQWHPMHQLSDVTACLPTASQIVVYTDGSFDGVTSSWAFHVVGEFEDSQVCLGWAGGRVITDAENPMFLGATHHGALPGELSALFWCATWILALPASTQVTILSDCTTAIRAVEGTAGQFRGIDLAATCRGIMQAIQSYKGIEGVRIHHIRSHVGHTGNEIADTLAKLCCRGESHIHPWQDHPICQFVRKGWLQWLWLYIDACRQPQAWPRQSGGFFVDDSRSEPAPPTKAECEAMLGLRPAAVHDKSDGQGSSTVHLWASLITINVQSLQSGDRTDTQTAPEPAFVGKAALLREQLVDLKVSVAALQETRIGKSETFQSQTHIRFCSACDPKGSYGTELWFSRIHPFFQHPVTPIYFQMSDFLVVHWDPRSIAVRFSRGDIKVLFVAIHAPTSSSPERDPWWRDLEYLLRRLQQESKLVLIGDFNLHLDRTHGQRVGDLVWPTTTPPPASFWGLLDVFDLWIPSTFSCCHWGPSETWSSPAGNTAYRLDYVALPASWQVQAQGSYIVPELDWGQSRVDHYPLIVHTTAYVNLSPHRRRGQVRLDTTAMRTPEGQCKIRSICDNIPTPAWETDVHRHAAVIEQHFQRLLPIAFPAPRTKQMRAYLQPATWQVRNQRAWLRRRVQAVSKTGRNLTTRAAFSSWRGGIPFRTNPSTGMCMLPSVHARTSGTCHSLEGHQPPTQTACTSGYAAIHKGNSSPSRTRPHPGLQYSVYEPLLVGRDANREDPRPCLQSRNRQGSLQPLMKRPSQPGLVISHPLRTADSGTPLSLSVNVLHDRAARILMRMTLRLKMFRVCRN